MLHTHNELKIVAFSATRGTTSMIKLMLLLKKSWPDATTLTTRPPKSIQFSYGISQSYVGILKDQKSLIQLKKLLHVFGPFILEGVTRRKVL
jgi:hypothetical protein